MENLRSFAAVGRSVMSEARDCCLPLYGTYCFSEIAGTAASLLGSRMGWNRLPDDCLPRSIGHVRRVVLLLVDALGWDSVREFDHGLLAQFRREGVVSKLTSQFPSTTAACVPTLATGKTVGENGVYEWWMYLPEAGDLISPLTFSSRENRSRRGSLLEKGVAPNQLFPNPSIYSRSSSLWREPSPLGGRVVRAGSCEPHDSCSGPRPFGGATFPPEEGRAAEECGKGDGNC